jgi:hypothetical protein
MLASEYTHTDVTGRVLHRAEWLADAGNARSWQRAPEGNATPSIAFDDMTIEISGAVAVITGSNTIRSADPRAEPIRLRFTQVLILEGGEWKRRFFQATPIAAR